MADTGWKFPGTMVGNRTISGSDADWTNADNCKADDGNNASVTVPLLSGSESSGLAASNFDFSVIPAGATIDGIEIRVGDYIVSTGGSLPSFSHVRLILADTSDGTEDKSNELVNWNSGSVQTDEAGGSNDLWLEGLTRANVQDVDFGFFIAATHTIGGETVFDVDFMQMRVFYHEGFPTRISVYPGVPSYNPLHQSSGGDFYSVVIEPTSGRDHVVVKKTADPEAADSWTAQDTGDEPIAGSSTGNYEVLSTVQDGDVIHMAVYEDSDVKTEYQYQTFNMATDQWVTTLQLIDNVDSIPTLKWISIAVRSDGDVVVAYDAETDQVMGGKKERVDVTVRDVGDGFFGSPIALDAAGDLHYGNPNVVKGPLTDDMHIVFFRQTDLADPPTSWSAVAGATRARTLDLSDTLSDVVTGTRSPVGTLLGCPNLVSYDDSGTQRIAVVANESGSLIRAWRSTEDGSDDIQALSDVIATTNDPYANGEVGVISLAEDAGDLHCLFAGGGTIGVDQDLYYTKSTDDGANWDTPTEEIDNVTVNFISANIYVRGTNIVLAYVYDDNGVQKYNEKIISSDIFGRIVRSDQHIANTAFPSGNLGNNPTSGNLLVITYSAPNNVRTLDTPPTGFTALHESSGGTGSNWYSFYKISAGTEQIVIALFDAADEIGVLYVEYIWGEGTPDVTTNEDVTNIEGSVTTQASGALTPGTSHNIMLAGHGIDLSSNGFIGQAINGSWIEDFPFLNESGGMLKLSRLVDVTGSQEATHTSSGTNDEMYGTIVAFDVSTGGPVTGAVTFALDAAKNISSVKTTLESIIYNIQLNQILSNLKITSEVGNFNIDLLQNQDATISIEEAITFVINLIQAQQNQKDAVEVLNLNGILNFIFNNLLVANKFISINVLLDQILNINKITSESEDFLIDLDMQESGIISIVGTINFDIVNTFQADNFGVLLAQASADIILTQAEEVNKLTSELTNFDFNLVLDEVTQIIRSASIIFTDNMGIQQIIGLVGEAVETFAVELTQLQDNIKITSESLPFDAQLILAQNNIKSTSDSFTLNTQLNIELLNKLIAETNISFDTTLDFSNIIQSDLIKAITFLTNLDLTLDTSLTINIDFALSILETVQVQRILRPALSMITNLSLAVDKQMVAEKTINYLVQLQQQQTTEGAITAAVSFILNISQTEFKVMTAAKAFTFIIDLAEQNNIQLTTNETITLLIQLADIYSNTRIMPEALILNIELEQIQTKLLTKLLSISFITLLDKVVQSQIDFSTIVNFIIDLAEQKNVQLTTDETVILLTQLADNYFNTKVIPETLILNTELQQIEISSLTKLLEISFTTLLDKIVQPQIDFNTIINFATILAQNIVGDVPGGAIAGAITLALNMQQENVNIATLLSNISFDSLLDLQQIPSRELLESLNISVQLDQQEAIDLTAEGFVTFQSFYNKLISNTKDSRPSINFDLQAIESSAASKNTLATILLNMEASMIESNTRTVPSLINYAVLQDIQTEIKLIADGQIILSTQMAESSIIKLLGEAGITLGHLLGLSSIGSSILEDSITFGSIQNVIINGNVLQFDLVTPKRRTLKIMFEDRTTIIYIAPKKDK